MGFYPLQGITPGKVDGTPSLEAGLTEEHTHVKSPKITGAKIFKIASREPSNLELCEPFGQYRLSKL